jgi:hypothetical protein
MKPILLFISLVFSSLISIAQDKDQKLIIITQMDIAGRRYLEVWTRRLLTMHNSIKKIVLTFLNEYWDSSTEQPKKKINAFFWGTLASQGTDLW